MNQSCFLLIILLWSIHISHANITDNDRDIIIVISVTVCLSIVIIAIAICCGCLYYFKKFRQIHNKDEVPENKKEINKISIINGPPEMLKLDKYFDDYDNEEVKAFGTKVFISKSVFRPEVYGLYRVHKDEHSWCIEQVFISDFERKRVMNNINLPEKVSQLYNEQFMIKFDNETDTIYAPLNEEIKTSLHSEAINNNCDENANTRENLFNKSQQEETISCNEICVSNNNRNPQLKQLSVTNVSTPACNNKLNESIKRRLSFSDSVKDISKHVCMEKGTMEKQSMQRFKEEALAHSLDLSMIKLEKH